MKVLINGNKNVRHIENSVMEVHQLNENMKAFSFINRKI